MRRCPMASDAIGRCPFCGRVCRRADVRCRKLLRWSGESGPWGAYVMCPNPRCSTDGPLRHSSKSKATAIRAAIKAWQGRA